MTVEEKTFPGEESAEIPPDEAQVLPDELETPPDEPEEALPDELETWLDELQTSLQTRSWRYFIAGMGVAVLAMALGAVLGYLLRPALEPAASVAVGVTTLVEGTTSVAGASVAAAPTANAPTSSIAAIVQAGGHSKGAAGTPIVMVEYSDFQCPFCTRHAREVAPRLEEAYIKTGQIRLVYKHFIVKGPDSTAAAVAAECAGEQNKFWEYHDLLFAKSGEVAFNADNLKAFAAKLGLDMVAFNQCFDSQKYLAVVEANSAEAQQLGVGGTPGFFINGASVAGAQPFEVFQQALEAELVRVKSTGDGTTPVADSASTGANEPPLPTGSAGENVATPTSASASVEATPLPVEEQWDVEIAQLRGLGFSADGRQLFVATNDGFRVFADGVWSVPDLPKHDYLGYTVADDGFYSSGYPDPAANMVSPLGLVKSSDEGKTLTPLAFEGESDFNLVGVGYRNHAIYVFNGVPNSKLTLGIHYSLDDGQTWQESALRGLKSRPARIAVHPTEANRVAIATEGGLLLSSDYGDTFEPVGEGGPAIAAAFDPGGALLFFGYQQLSAHEWANQKVLDLPTPAIVPEDAIAYIAVSPTKIEEMAFATFLGDLHLSRDGGQIWQQILKAGKGKSGQ
jgi:protein-disulfide isomerase